ncbi:serine hydrolase-domain-containing protein [Syncephalis plumigaleata]|nr:serine hydrolase-domain-containing protein [Syncephalis plumigaleata]
MSTKLPLKYYAYTNGGILRKKMGVIRKKLKSVAELVYITAPHPVPMPSDITDEERARLEKLYDSEDKELHPYAWWFSSDDRTKYRGDAETFDRITKILKKRCCIGFYASINLCTTNHPLRYGCDHPAFRFSILVSGFITRNLIIKPYDNTFIVRVFMLWQGGYTITPAECFEGPVIYKHDGGHFIPSNAEARQAFASFVLPFATTNEGDTNSHVVTSSSTSASVKVDTPHKI